MVMSEAELRSGPLPCPSSPAKVPGLGHPHPGGLEGSEAPGLVPSIPTSFSYLPRVLSGLSVSRGGILPSTFD